MISREIALEALGVLCDAEVIVVDQSDGYRDSFGDGPGGAELSSVHQLHHRVLEADQRRFKGRLQSTDEKKEIKRPADSPVRTQDRRICTGEPQFAAIKVEDISKMKLTLSIDDKKFFDPGYDYDFTNVKDTETYYRGGEKYERPCGYKRFALKVKGKYEDDTWLGPTGRGTESVEGEWPVSYHGTKANCVDPIINGHLKAGDGAKFGRGIYSTPHISVAEGYATEFIANKDKNKYKVILQNRINTNHREKHNDDKYYLIKIPAGTSAEEEKELVNRAIRPYGLLIKEVK